MPKYFCEVNYRTPAGFPGTFQIALEAKNIDAASAMARALCLRRRKVAKVDGGSTVLELKPRDRRLADSPSNN